MIVTYTLLCFSATSFLTGGHEYQMKGHRQGFRKLLKLKKQGVNLASVMLNVFLTNKPRSRGLVVKADGSRSRSHGFEPQCRKTRSMLC